MRLLNFIFLEILILSLIVKAILVNIKFIDNDSSLYYRVFQSVSHDSIIFFAIFLLVYISYLKIIPKIIGFLLRFTSFILISLYLIDIYILISFANHLVLNDVIKYISYAPLYLEQIYSFDSIKLTIFSLFGILVFNFLFNKFEIKKENHHIAFSSLILIFLFFSFFSDNGRFIHSWLYKNFIEYNYDIIDQAKNYSKKTINSSKDSEEFICENSELQNPNIIILMVESLSSYQSKYFSNIKNWTPNLDKIAKENLAYKNFYANGFVTEDAEIAMLTGELPIYAPGAFTNGGGVSFSGFYNLENTLPEILKNKNYQSEFITSSDLNFSNTGNWAKSIGFDYLEGSEHKDYEGKKRFHFKAAADEYLYKRVLSRLKTQDSNYMLFIKTVSSHAPFINPETLNRDEEETIRYIDKQLGTFYEKLQKSNFFQNGILFIVGDHHPVIPLKNSEIKKYGELKASSITPLVIAYKNKKGVNNKAFQQTDIYTTIKNLTSSKTCTSKWHKDLLQNEKADDSIIVHRRGDQRGIISIFLENEEFNIKLKGDETHALSTKKHQSIVEKINFTRIERLEEKYNFKD